MNSIKLDRLADVLTDLIDRVEKHYLLSTIILCILVFSSRAFYSALTLYDDNLAFFRGWNGYGEIARNLAAGHGYAISNLLTYFPGNELHPTAVRVPLPILFDAAMIRIFGDQEAPIYLMQALFETATVAVTIVTAKVMTGRYAYGLLAGIFYLGFVPAVHFARTMGSEPLATLLFAFLALALVCCNKMPSWKTFLCSGMLLGALTLTRPSFLGLSVPLFLLFLFRPGLKRVRLVVPMFIVGVAIVLAPWVIRNYITLGKPIVTATLSGYGLYGNYHRLARDTYLSPPRPLTSKETGEVIENLLSEKSIELDGLNEITFDELLRDEAMTIIRRHKGRYAIKCLQHILWLFSLIGGEIQLIALVVMLLIFSLACYGMYQYARNQNIFEALLFLVILASWIGIHALYFGMLRYLVPLTPIFFVFVAYGCIYVLEKRSNRPGNDIGRPIHLP